MTAITTEQVECKPASEFQDFKPCEHCGQNSNRAKDLAVALSASARSIAAKHSIPRPGAGALSI